MKKIVLICLITISLTVTLDGQYRENRQLYDPKTYHFQSGDRLYPPLAGISSFFIPGTGQWLSGSVGRGFAFFVPYLTLGTMGIVGLFMPMVTMFEETQADYITMAYIGLIGAGCVMVWSSIDAVRVAKVNNMAHRSGDNAFLQINPYISPTVQHKSLTAGLSLTVRW